MDQFSDEGRMNSALRQGYREAGGEPERSELHTKAHELIALIDALPEARDKGKARSQVLTALYWAEPKGRAA